jgi:hypothetical protein
MVHWNGKRTTINSYSFDRNVRAGNLIQTEEQRRADPTTAYVLPGLVGYVDPKSPGEVLKFEVARRMSVSEIEAQLVDLFGLKPGPARKLAIEIVRRREVEGLRKRDEDIGAPRGLQSQWWKWVWHMIRDPRRILTVGECDNRMLQGLPLVEFEPVIPGDPETAFAIYR